MIVARSQGFEYPTLKQHVGTINDLAPKGWSILDSANGDLNGDNVDDLAVVMQRVDSTTLIITDQGYVDTVRAQPRMLAILIATLPKGGYELNDQSDSFILEHSDPITAEPLVTLEIDSGILRIGFSIWQSMGSWWVEYVDYGFAMREGQLRLINAETGSFNRATHESTDYHFDLENGKYTMVKNSDLEADGLMSSETGDLPSLHAMTLRSLRRPWNWEIMPDVFL
jgi:hypothetical protein